MDGDWLGELTAAQTVKCTQGVDTIANTWKHTHTDTRQIQVWKTDTATTVFSQNEEQLDFFFYIFWIHIEAHDALKATQRTAASYIYETQIGLRNSPHMYRLNKQHVGLRIAFICDL